LLRYPGQRGQRLGLKSFGVGVLHRSPSRESGRFPPQYQFAPSRQVRKQTKREQPEEAAYVRSAAQLAAYRRQFQKARKIIKGLIDKGQATANDLNLYAWYALFIPDPVEQDTIDAALRANDLTNYANFAMLRTLGCVYAAAGETNQSRELLLKAMDSLYLNEPNSDVWFGLGLIAEQYGEFAAAAQMFDRVERPDLATPGTPYALAQQHLAALGIAANDSAQIAT
jgi:tetratricopeptide (TPR) repeat protein